MDAHKESLANSHSVNVHELDLENRNHAAIHIDRATATDPNVVAAPNMLRPLPPLPKSRGANSLQSIDEPASTDEDALDDDEEEDDDENSDDTTDDDEKNSNSDSDNEHVPGASDSEDDEVNVADDSGSNGSNDNDVDMNETTAVPQVPKRSNGIEESFDANATLPPSPTTRNAAPNNGLPPSTTTTTTEDRDADASAHSGVANNNER